MAQTSRDRLNHLLELAAQGAAGRAGLLDDLADLLTDWPADYAQAMRGPFETLFEKTAREADAATRTRLAARLADHGELPVTLLNGFFLDADAATRAHILRRNAALGDEEEDAEAEPARADGMGQACADYGAPIRTVDAGTAREVDGGRSLAADSEPTHAAHGATRATDGATLVAAARRTVNGAFVEIFADALALPRVTARAILADSGAMAIACKGAGIDRAAYSALALLAGGTAPADYDAIPRAAARKLVGYWRERG